MNGILKKFIIAILEIKNGVEKSIDHKTIKTTIFYSTKFYEIPDFLFRTFMFKRRNTGISSL